jgi:hypothetical protein
MFLKSYVEVTVTFEAVQTVMLREPQTWLDGLAVTTEQEGERLLVDVGLEVGGRRLQRAAELVLGQPQATQVVASLPLRLRVHGDQRLLPSFYGSLDAAWLGPTRTQLALSLQYEPPLGIVGRAVDRTLLHRVAETAARNFLEKAAHRLQERAVQGAAGGAKQASSGEGSAGPISRLAKTPH